MNVGALIRILFVFDLVVCTQISCFARDREGPSRGNPNKGALQVQRAVEEAKRWETVSLQQIDCRMPIYRHGEDVFVAFEEYLEAKNSSRAGRTEETIATIVLSRLKIPTEVAVRVEFGGAGRNRASLGTLCAERWDRSCRKTVVECSRGRACIRRTVGEGFEMCQCSVDSTEEIVKKVDDLLGEVASSGVAGADDVVGFDGELFLVQLESHGEVCRFGYWFGDERKEGARKTASELAKAIDVLYAQRRQQQGER